MDGILIIDKPTGLTSHDVVARVRRILKTKRVGHTGTLDPFATGVLVLLVGKATRLAQFLDKDEKEYEAIVKFGHETDTGDRTGTPRDRQSDDTRQYNLRKQVSENTTLLDSSEIEDALQKFRGTIQQIPPMYSAKKIDGKKLYEHARQGREVERKPATVKISKLEELSPEHDGPALDFDTLTLRVACSAGTYIRTLAEDIGRELGVGAHLYELRRTRAGKFTIGQSVTLEALEQLDDPGKVLLPLKEAVAHLPEMHLPPDRVERTRSGLSSRFDSEAFAGQSIQMLGPDLELVAVGVYDSTENIVQPKVVLI